MIHTGGLLLSKQIFMEAAGLHDERNKMKELNAIIDEKCEKEGYIWYHTALNLYKELYESGKYYMYPLDTLPTRVLDHIDDWIAAGKIVVEYKK